MTPALTFIANNDLRLRNRLA